MSSLEKLLNTEPTKIKEVNDINCLLRKILTQYCNDSEEFKKISMKINQNNNILNDIYNQTEEIKSEYLKNLQKQIAFIQATLVAIMLILLALFILKQ